jgi:glycosyltransferase involved in cell wall biosynthesis
VYLENGNNLQMNLANSPLISVVMITYNHENFIQQAIEGVLMQEFSGEIELIIANDCSPDGTDGVIKTIIENHPRGAWIKYTNHPVNMGMMNNFIWALKQAKGKYVALCEGDDYWIDSLKLQKQVDFLEKNDGSVLSFTKSMELFQQNSNLIETIYPENIENLNIQKLLSNEWFIRTASIVFVRDKLDIAFIGKLEYSADYFLQLLLIIKGKFHFLKETTSVYRHHPGGISNCSIDLFLKRRVWLCENLKQLNIETNFEYNSVFKENIKKIEIDILDHAILNFKMKYFYLIRINNIDSVLIHFLKRVKIKFFSKFIL